MILLKTDTVHREGSHCLSTLPWISNSHSQMCATPTGKASTQFHQCSLSPGNHFWEAHTTSCVQSSLQRGHWERSAGTLLFPPTEQGVRHTLGEKPHSRSNPDLCTTSGLCINAQLGAFQEAQHTTHRITTLPTTDMKGECIYTN